MKTITKTLALAALMTTLAGAAMAADSAMKDCCDKCPCCKEKEAGSQAPAGGQPAAPEHKH